MAGEIVGNDSVHWRIVHDDRTTGQPKNTPMKGAKGGSIAAGDEVEMRLQSEVRGRDGIPFDNIGQKPGLTPLNFRVTLRFTKSTWPNLNDLKTALKARIDAMTSVGSQHVLQVDVPAIHRNQGHVNPANPDPEVHVDW